MPPIAVMVKPVSGMCNMQCSYCFYADEMRNREIPIYQKMDAETLGKLIRKTFAYAERKVAFAFQGGEPTLAGAAFYQRVLELQKHYTAAA